MATDYDTPWRANTGDIAEDSLEELEKARDHEALLAVVDIDGSEAAESFELPDSNLSSEDLLVQVIPKQSNEFVCSNCFLVHHRSRLTSTDSGAMLCRDCAV
jgi:hypothetical protein